MKFLALTCCLTTLLFSCGCGKQPTPLRPVASMSITCSRVGPMKTDLWNPDRTPRLFTLEHKDTDNVTRGVDWQFVGASDRGDVYVVVVRTPDLKPSGEIARAVVYTGGTLELYHDAVFDARIVPRE